MRLFEGTQFDVPPRCDRCNELESDCQCPPPPPTRVPPNKQTIRVAAEKRKHGRMMTCVRDLHELDAQEVLVKLKNAFGSGGTVKDGVVELQGDHAEEAKQLLSESGYRIKK